MLSPAWGLAGGFICPLQLSQAAHRRVAWVLKASCCHANPASRAALMKSAHTRSALDMTP